MSRDDFEFGDDPFGDDDEFGDDTFASEDDFDFGGDEFNELDDIEYGEVDDDFFDDEDTSGGGPNKTFVFLAGLLVLVFIAGLVIVVFLALRDTGPTPIQQTSTAITNLNNTQVAFLSETETQAVEDAILAETQAVEIELTSTAVANENATQVALLEATETQLAEEAFAAETQTAEAPDPIALLQTEQAADALTQEALLDDDENDVDEPVDPDPPVGIGDVALTSTALAETFLTLTPPAVDPADATPTQEIGGPFAPTPPPTLPDTGLFDDLSGGENMGLIMLIAFGLVGVIFGARRLRARNERRNKD